MGGNQRLFAGLVILLAAALSPSPARGQDWQPDGQDWQTDARLHFEWPAEAGDSAEWGRFHLNSPSLLWADPQAPNFSLVFRHQGVERAVFGRRRYPDQIEPAMYAGSGCPAGWFHVHLSTVCPVEGAAACGAVCFAQPNCGATLSWISYRIPPVCQDMCKCDPEE
jgi:hypothetical protein